VSYSRDQRPMLVLKRLISSKDDPLTRKRMSHALLRNQSVGGVGVYLNHVQQLLQEHDRA